MGLFIGMDEAGYGPNLGPLVVTATVWETPGDPADVDLWQAFAEILSQGPCNDGSRLHVADSKQVYSPARGLGPLEQAVLTAVELAGHPTAGFQALWRSLTESTSAAENNGFSEPWLADDLDLPVAKSLPAPTAIVERWQTCCERHGLRLRNIRSDVVVTPRFNRLLHDGNNKAAALSRISLQLLRGLWDPDEDGPTLIVADKHGGRNCYQDLLAEVLDGRMLLCRGESRTRSVYRVGCAEIHFQSKAESHLPVALASMVSKYVRELAMLLFNRFWGKHVPGLKPTKGYPVDAIRFHREISGAQRDLGIPDEVLWRER